MIPTDSRKDHFTDEELLEHSLDYVRHYALQYPTGETAQIAHAFLLAHLNARTLDGPTYRLTPKQVKSALGPK